MEAKYQELLNAYLKSKYICKDYSACINWATNELELGSDNLNVAILAGLDNKDHLEIKKYIENIIKTELNESSNYNQSWAGKYIVELSEKYNNNELTIENLNNEINILFNKLECPDWLVMLSRNCEYATDIEYFKRHFEEELAYISGLWETSANIEDFNKKYDRKVSNTHDIPGSLISRRDSDL